MNDIIHISSIEEIVDLLLEHNHLVIEHGWFDDRFHFMTLDLQRDLETDSNTILFHVHGESYGFEWYPEGVIKNIINWMRDATKIHLITDDNRRYSIGDQFKKNFDQRMECYINGVIRDITTAKLIASK